MPTTSTKPTSTKQTTTTDAAATARAEVAAALDPLGPFFTRCPDVVDRLRGPLEAWREVRAIGPAAARTERSLDEERGALARRAAALALDERRGVPGATAALAVVAARAGVVARRLEAERHAGEEARRREPELRAALEAPLTAVGLGLVRALEAQRDAGITQLCAEGASMPMDERLAVAGLARGAYGCATDLFRLTHNGAFKRTWDLDERLGAAARLVKQSPLTPKPPVPRPWAPLVTLLTDTNEEG